ncbi:hypothetical protein UPYG_G00035540 [Umbra pygmaea]|uniref:Uncharacterized protein n=1 Tax=Umbra pygmaea TaxID=75934 RepID=A0ABD0YAR6_UMBPY
MLPTIPARYRKTDPNKKAAMSREAKGHRGLITPRPASDPSLSLPERSNRAPSGCRQFLEQCANYISWWGLISETDKLGIVVSVLSGRQKVDLL